MLCLSHVPLGHIHTEDRLQKGAPPPLFCCSIQLLSYVHKSTDALEGESDYCDHWPNVLACVVCCL